MRQYNLGVCLMLAVCFCGISSADACNGVCHVRHIMAQWLNRHVPYDLGIETLKAIDNAVVAIAQVRQERNHEDL
jgi:hypothetical protein